MSAGVNKAVRAAISSNSSHGATGFAVNGRTANSLPPDTAHIGNLRLLDEPLTALFCSNRCPGDLILKTYDLARAMRDAGVPVIGGFQTPMERECLGLLLRGSQPLVVCPARGIDNMRVFTRLAPRPRRRPPAGPVALPIYSSPPDGGARGSAQRPRSGLGGTSLHCPRSTRKQDRGLRP